MLCVNFILKLGKYNLQYHEVHTRNTLTQWDNGDQWRATQATMFKEVLSKETLVVQERSQARENPNWQASR